MNCNLQTNSNRKFLGLKKDPVLSFMSTNLNFAVLYSTVYQCAVLIMLSHLKAVECQKWHFNCFQVGCFVKHKLETCYTHKV